MHLDDEGLETRKREFQHLYEQGLLSEAAYRIALAGLGLDPDTVFAQQQQRVEEQHNVAGDYYDQRQYFNGPPDAVPLDGDVALARYLNHVIEANRRLELQGIRSASGLVSIALEEIYVTLTTTVRATVTEERAWLAEMERRAPGEARRMRDVTGSRVQQVKVDVQEALALHSRLVVLGDPGCGKTTLLRYLALTYARDFPLGPPHGGDFPLSPPHGGDVWARLGLDEHRLPVLLPLRDFAHYLEREYPDAAGTDGPKRLLAFLRIYFANQDIVLPERFFADRLHAGACVVLLDGVDEVASFATRQRVARLIERFTIAYPGNRYVVTSRIVGYTAGARLGAEYAATTVRDFTDADIERFVAHWNRAVEVALAGGETDYALRQAKTASDKLLVAIRGNERVRELAVNPLLLTVIALVQRYRAQLPDRRVELYEEAIEVLLVQWDAVKGLPATETLQGLVLDAGDRRSLLEPVALWMMEQHLREIEVDDLRGQLARPFRTMLQDSRAMVKAVNGFVHLINARSGLLTERGQGVYAFSHLTFQEHLAARAVADREDYVAYTLARVGDSWWREVVLLEAGYLSTQGKRRATELIRAIMELKEEPEPYHNLVLAAEAVRDVGPARAEGDLAGEIRRRLRQAFTVPLRKGNDLKGAIERRAAAAEALAKIEGGAFGAQPGFWTRPYGEPVWIEIPAGEFWMGSERGQEREKPVHKVYLERYWIARVPVTNAQYRFFVEATDREPPDHWEDGRVPRGLESHPVVNVTWHDALAYCTWLSEVTGKAITLPSEAEWEKAARGAADKREYPWGDTWKEGYCNSDELAVGDTTPVGIFPEGISPCGCLDMVGNVWEWTRSLWGPWDGKDYSSAKLQFIYPYQIGDARENLEADDKWLRVLRGGSFFSDRSFARCAVRGGILPSFRLRDLGFRVAVSPSRAAPSLSFGSLPFESLE